MTKTLDLGCGSRPKNPFNADELFGVDVRANLEGNIKSADLVVEPIPFPDGFFEYVTAFDFLEHIPRLVYAPARRNAFIELMNEIYRVLKPGGFFLSSTPAYPHAVAFRDPTHVNFITDETFPLYFDDVNRWASIYGFTGAFGVRIHEMRGPAIFAVLQKVPVPQVAEPAAEPAAASAPVPATVLAVEKSPAISVFMPVYDGERFLAESLDALLAQTFTDYEALCIDDGSHDGSRRILDAYAAKDARIRVLSTPTNLGSVPKVLNFALPQMRGAYFVYSSQDDLYSTDWLEKMHARAVETDADAVLPDLVFHHAQDPSRNRSLVGLRGDRNAVIAGREAVVHSLDWSISANALWKAGLIRKLGFEDFAMNSDEYSARVFFLNCSKVAFSEGSFLYRQDNPQAITKKITVKTFDLPHTHHRLFQFLRDNGFPAQVCQWQAQRAADTLKSLQDWLAANGAAFSPADQNAAAGKLERCRQGLAADQLAHLLPA